MLEFFLHPWSSWFLWGSWWNEDVIDPSHAAERQAPVPLVILLVLLSIQAIAGQTGWSRWVGNCLKECCQYNHGIVQSLIRVYSVSHCEGQQKKGEQLRLPPDHSCHGPTNITDGKKVTITQATVCYLSAWSSGCLKSWKMSTVFAGLAFVNPAESDHPECGPQHLA